MTATEDKNVFVTVGTTSFDKLIEQILRCNGYRTLLMQVGHGVMPSDEPCCGVTMSSYRYKDSISEDIKNADLVISHAGAGSCLEVLGAKKPLVVVINDELMGNHQTELAQELSKEGYLLYSTCRNLAETLHGLDVTACLPFEPGKPEKFATFLDRAMGIS